jgi:diacylglycerol kinase family enzyme
LYLVNRRAGRGDGARLARLVVNSIGDRFVHDLADGPPGPVFRERWREVDGVVVCGGDGSVNWVLETLNDLAIDLPVAIWPVGTGNDFARSLGWPERSPLPGNLSAFERELEGGRVRRQDRWVLDGPFGRLPFYCYCSFGADARIALRFHRGRQNNPWLFRGPIANKILYGLIGLQELGWPLAHWLQGAPARAGALLLSNIPSYAGGATIDSGIDPADGRLDAHWLPTGLSMGLALSGRRPPPRYHGPLEFIVQRPVALQIDGEPRLAPPGRYRVRHGGRVSLLAPAGLA